MRLRNETPEKRGVQVEGDDRNTLGDIFANARDARPAVGGRH